MSEVTTFESGAIRDSQAGKLDMIETLGYLALGEFSKYMTAKKQKYGSGNFKRGIPVESYEQSLIRHWHKYMCIKELTQKGINAPDEFEPGEDHISAIVFNAFGILFERAVLDIKARNVVDVEAVKQDIEPPPFLR